MEFKVKCEPIEKLECKDDVSFTPNEYSLKVKFIYPPPTRKENLADLLNKSFEIPSRFLVRCGTLLLEFDGEDKRLESIDDYDWGSPWIPRDLDLPIATSLGKCLVHSIATNGDEGSMDSDLKYFIDEPKKILKIILWEAENQKFYRISPNVIIGIANDLPSTLFIHPFEIKNN